MKNTNKNILILLLFGVAFGACKKQLNVFPTTTEVDGNVITDAKSAATTLNGVYYRFAAGGADYNGVPGTAWYSVNENIPSQLSGMLSYTNGGGGYDEHHYSADDVGIATTWSYGYAIVNAANGFLKNIAPLKAIETASKNQMIAEAKFLRAFGNATLLLYYGQYDDTTSKYGIILRDEFVQTDNVYLPRSKVGAAYDAILSDIDEALPDLPATNSQKWYATTWAAKLLKARVLINRGTQADMQQVIALTSDIIGNSPFALEASVKDIFWTKGFSSTEVIMGVQPFSTQKQKWQSYIYYDDYGPNDFMTGLFEHDARAPWQIQTVKGPYGAKVASTKYYPGSVTNIAATPITENSYAFRATEAYLLKAEALVASGGSMSDAKTLLKTIMSHAGNTDFSAVDAALSGADLQLLIVKEEMKSFVTESGQDWFAVRRLPFETLQGLLPSVLDKSLLILPIPLAEITANGKVIQNPNY